MKNLIITGIMAATILLAGCDKKNGSPVGSATPPKAQTDPPPSSFVLQPALTAWQQGDKAGEIGGFLAADWSARPRFAAGSALNLSENQFKALSDADREAKSRELTMQLATLKQLAAAVEQAGLDAATKGDAAQAQKCFTSLKQCGMAFEGPDYTLIVQLVGKALE